MAAFEQDEQIVGQGRIKVGRDANLSPQCAETPRLPGLGRGHEPRYGPSVTRDHDLIAPQGTINEMGQMRLGLVDAHRGDFLHMVKLDHTVKPGKNDTKSAAWEHDRLMPRERSRREPRDRRQPVAAQTSGKGKRRTPPPGRAACLCVTAPGECGPARQ